MARSTNAVARHRKKKRYLRAAKGYWGARSKLWRIAKNAVERGWAYAYRDRKQRKRQFRRLWIARINAAVRAHDDAASDPRAPEHGGPDAEPAVRPDPDR